MAVARTTILFFDASTLVAAAGRPAGGSGFLLSLVGTGFLGGAVSQPVLLEAERNIRAKLHREALGRFHDMLLRAGLLVAPLPSPAVVSRYADAVGEKDAHVIAAALAIRAPFLITLDQPLARRVTDAGYLPRPLSPGAFITTELPIHPEFSTFRPGQ